jgi:hypothetical protein
MCIRKSPEYATWHKGRVRGYDIWIAGIESMLVIAWLARNKSDVNRRIIFP